MDNKLTCEFCGKTFKRETFYLKHKCEQMKRYELFNTVQGHSAYLLFNQWRKICGYPSVTVETFATSKYFKSFIKFADFSKSQSIPDKIGYIELMVEKRLLPFNWCDVDVYDFYIETFDKTYPIDKKVDISLQTLMEIARKQDCEVSEIFDKVSGITVLKYITSRKLSPWVLLTSKKFMDFMTYRVNKEERLLFNTFINVQEWKKLFLQNKEKFEEVQNINKQLGI